MNILKLLYNSYNFSLLDDLPRRIHSGVAQDSLVSHLLNGWYVNDLVSQLTSYVAKDSVFVYADDIAVLCLGLSEVRKLLHLIEKWCEANGASLNKKKCGILPVYKREACSTRRSWRGSRQFVNTSTCVSRFIPL